MKTKIEPFNYQHYIALCGVDNVNAAIVSQMTGRAFTLMTDERKPHILAMGGIRNDGIGQAWAKFDEKALKDFPKLILETAKGVIEAAIRTENLYKVYAEATVDKPAWFEHLGFHKQNNIWIR